MRLMRRSPYFSLAFFFCMCCAVGAVSARAWAAQAMTPEQGRSAFRDAMLQQEQGRAKAAREAFESVWTSYPPLADYAAHALAETARDDHARLTELADALAQRYPHSLHLPSLRLLLAQAQRRFGQRQQALATLARVLQAEPSHRVIPEALFLRGQLEEDAGQIAKAALTFKQMGDAYPRHAQAASAFKRSRELLQRLPAAQRPRFNPEDELDAIDKLIKARRWGGSPTAFQGTRPPHASSPATARACSCCRRLRRSANGAHRRP